MPVSNKHPYEDSPQAFAALTAAKRVLLVAHQKPDGDTTSSSLALWHWLTALGKEAAVFCCHHVPETFLYLSHAQEINMDSSVFRQPWDVIVVCDSGDLAYAGIEAFLKYVPAKPVLINFDHHASNKYFGDYNLVDTAASSTAEVVAWFLKEHGQPITTEMGSCLLTGIFTDTNGFTNAATTPGSLQLAAEFLQAGASLPHVYRATMVNKNIHMLTVWGKVLSRLQTSVYGIVYTFVRSQDLPSGTAGTEAIEGISNYLTQLSDARAIMVFHDRGDGFVKASLRTVRDDIDLSAFALLFGGGGHQKASGFTIPGRLEETPDGLRIVAPASA
ncbi:MAG: bifunctional oligoribonuclease/PAP phosphatase NrnA [Parcubacteria group bacterium]|nr:bifunctional oligoribonuclease/PAP phosphatase NrnA [Parcubacteria group bacterium]